MSLASNLFSAISGAVRGLDTQDGPLDRAAESLSFTLSPRTYAPPPVVDVGEQEGRPAVRYTCPRCGDRVAPDAIDWGQGAPRLPLPGFCPTCGRALGALAPRSSDL